MDELKKVKALVVIVGSPMTLLVLSLLFGCGDREYFKCFFRDWGSMIQGISVVFGVLIALYTLVKNHTYAIKRDRDRDEREQLLKLMHCLTQATVVINRESALFEKGKVTASSQRAAFEAQSLMMEARSIQRLYFKDVETELDACNTLFESFIKSFIKMKDASSNTPSVVDSIVVDYEAKYVELLEHIEKVQKGMLGLF